MSLAVTSGWVANALAPGLLGRFRSRFAVAGIHVDVWGDAPESVDIGPQLLPFASDAELGEDIAVQIEWSDSIQPTRARELFHSGCLWSVHEFGDGFLFDFTTEHLGLRPYKRLLVDRDFRQALLREAVECILNGELDTGKAVLRDYVNATMGFQSLEKNTQIPAKSLMRMLGPKGSPSVANFSSILTALQRTEGVHFELSLRR